ncbi:hypothetical protein NDU88_000830 [Pleurodeles waltl]|uniref:Uncharacterized protein n=1 Tax=Pleurodeles waltl TaxID=8319 RepID=A0AAV7LE57_PLEWA|nr:hypothetical protein NDU88_000830 [Pleurodeles waltl]
MGVRGITGPKKVVVSTDLPAECLLGNNLETSTWAEVELEAHAAMLGIPGHIFALTRAQAMKQKDQGHFEIGTMAQELPNPKDRKGKKMAPTTTSPSSEDSPFEEEESTPLAEPTSEELNAYTAELLGEGGPAREEFCMAQKTCPTLEGLRQQALLQEAGDVSGTHKVYWKDTLFYLEPKEPKPGSTRRLVVPL